jgi:hypothetical protein
MTRLTHSDTICFEVQNSYFLCLSSQFGAAIWMSVSSGDLTVKASMFIQCHAIAESGDAYGGAIFQAGRAFRAEQSCFHAVMSVGYGSAIYSNQLDGTPSLVAETTFMLCGGPDLNCEGTVFEEREVDFTYRRLNFSICRVSWEGHSGGAVFTAFENDTSGAFTWSFSECNVCNCSGMTGIDSWTRFGQLLTFCNFFDNHMSLILLRVGFAGMNLQNCIFMGNTKECDPSSGSPRFMVTNCVFSGPLPSGDSDWLTSLNVFDSVTASFAYSYFFSEECLTPASSPAPTSTNSSQFSESQQFSHSLLLTHSFPLETSSRLRATRSSECTTPSPSVVSPSSDCGTPVETSAIETNEFTLSSLAYFRMGFILKGGLFSFLLF